MAHCTITGCERAAYHDSIAGYCEVHHREHEAKVRDEYLCARGRQARVGDYLEFIMETGDAESGPMVGWTAAVVEDADGTHVLVESPYDGEPMLVHVRDVIVLPPEASMEAMSPEEERDFKGFPWAD